MILGLGLDLNLYDPGWLDAYIDPIAPDGFSYNGVSFGEDDDFDPGTQANRGDGDLSGIEFEATWRATDNWSFRGSLALQDNVYSENCDPESVGDFGLEPDLTVAEDGVIADCVDVAGKHIEAGVRGLRARSPDPIPAKSATAGTGRHAWACAIRDRNTATSSTSWNWRPRRWSTAS